MDNREEGAGGLQGSKEQIQHAASESAEQQIDFHKSEGGGEDSQRSGPAGEELQSAPPKRAGHPDVREKSSLQDDEAVISPITF